MIGVNLDELKKRARESFPEVFHEMVNADLAEGEEPETPNFIRFAWEDSDPCLCEQVAEIIERSVELTVDRVFLWAHIVESADAERFDPDGWYAFIAVDPETGQCLTLHEDYCGKTILARFRILDEQEAVEAVTKLSCLILENLGVKSEG
jgi:6-pyruvoyl-tetrahydropterin synthase